MTRASVAFAIAGIGTALSCGSARTPVVLVAAPSEGTGSVPQQPSASAAPSAGPNTKWVKLIETGTDIQGGLHPMSVKSPIRASFQSLRKCYEAGLARDDKLTGIVSVTFIIDETGAVRDARVNDTSTMSDEAVRACVLDVYRGLSFNAPAYGKVLVTYPIEFRSGSGPI